MYVHDLDAHAELIQRLRSEATPEVPAYDPDCTPYWPDTGAVTFRDPNGYRLIITTP